MSTNWKNIGLNSGNMSRHRNVVSNRANYETGKFNSIYDASGKGYTFDISGQNIVFGVGTSEPFSRLSLGSNLKSGEFDKDNRGQLAAIALNEDKDGKNFIGMAYITDISGQKKNKTVHGLQIMASATDFSMNDISNGRIIISNDNVITIGGDSRVANEAYHTTTGTDTHSKIVNGDKRVVLDVRGSIRTDGYINFFNEQSTGTFEPSGSTWDDHEDVPIGSIFLSAGGTKPKTATPGLYWKNKAGEVNLIASSGGSGGTSDISAAFDVSFNNTKPYIVAKGISTTHSGGVPVTFSGTTWSKSDANGSNGFENTVTVRNGNISVCSEGAQNYLIKRIDSSLNDFFINNIYNGDDISGGIIFAERQLLLGPEPDPNTPFSQTQRSGYAIIEAQSVPSVPVFISYNTGETSNYSKFNPTSATNSLILLTKPEDHNGWSTTASATGNAYDCSNTIIIGGGFSNIDTPNSIISNLISTTTTTSITDPSGSNIVFGHNNTLNYSPYSLILGESNDISNALGDNKKQNILFGDNNTSHSSQNSFVQGASNENRGDLNVIFGDTNKLGKHYKTYNCFVQGNNNTINAPYHLDISNAFIAGVHNTLDLSYSLLQVNNGAYTLLGAYAGISGESVDTSNVRFAFGTYEKYAANTVDGGDNGNVFTIDCSGNTHIYGNLTVEGAQVIFRTEVFDVSDNNLSLNYPGLASAEGGGITIMDTTLGNKALKWTATGPSVNCWDTSGSDISTNNIYANDISCVDISCVDISASGHFYGNIYTTTGHSRFNDISANDISCVDISGVNGFFTNDLSCSNNMFVGGKLTVVGLIDPTGLILEDQSSAPAGFSSGADKSLLYSKTDEIHFVGTDNVDTTLASKTYVNGQVGGGSGTSAKAKKVEVTNQISGSGYELVFSAAATGGYEALYGHDGTLTYDPGTKTLRTTALVVSGDLSGNDASFNDISAASVTILGTTLFVGNTAYTFQAGGGVLGTVSAGGAFPGIGITTGMCIGSAGSIVDTDYLKVDGTTVVGKSASDVLIDINGQATVTGAATTITSNDLGFNFALISNGTGKVAVSAVTETQLGYVDATSSIQTQLNSKPTVTSGSGSPSSVSHATGDLYVKTDGTPTLYFADSDSTWTSV
jgi:hypothetical protein